MADTRWDKWRQNGRLATIALVLVAAFWYYYQHTTPKIDRDPIVSNSLYLMLGAWVVNIAFGVQKKQDSKDRQREDRTIAAEDKATAAEGKATEATEKLANLEQERSADGN